MAIKSKFLAVPYTVLYSGQSYDTGVKALAGDTSIEIKPPMHMVVTRVTFQILICASVPATGAILISDHVSTTTVDGYLLATIDEGGLGTRSLPGPSFTFENFGDESISQSFYVANVSPGQDDCFITVLFEGFINE